MNMLEAKLTSEHRNDMPDREFGLPKERKYPLHDESHVRMAIIYFKYCKLDQRGELAKNINLKLKKFDMTIKVSKDNPFYKYINKQHLTESVIPMIESSFSYVPGTNPNITFNDCIVDLINMGGEGIDERGIINAEQKIYRLMHTTTDTGPNLLSFLDAINNIFEIIYTEYFQYLQYTDGDRYCMTSWYYPLLNDFRKTFMMRLTAWSNDIDISPVQRLYFDFITSCKANKLSHNWYYIYRINAEIYHTILNRMGDNVHLNIIDVDSFALPNQIPNISTIRIVLDDLSSVDVSQHDVFANFDHVRDVLLRQKKQLEDDLFMLRSDTIIDPLRNNVGLSSLYHIDNDDIVERIDRIMRAINISNRLFNIVHDSVFILSQDDIVRLTHTKYIERIITSRAVDGVIYYFGIKGSVVYIICKQLSNHRLVYKLILANDDCCDYLYSGMSDTKPKITIVNIVFPEGCATTGCVCDNLTEGFYINENGDIKITINPKKSYMDEYAEAHRILIENYKNKNYDAMKQNVAFMFLLISIIERDNRYKKREPEIVKARAFAINDFKTYLSHIQKADPSFNFEQYYRNSEFDKYILNIPKETIIGIKNLLKTILM